MRWFGRFAGAAPWLLFLPAPRLAAQVAAFDTAIVAGGASLRVRVVRGGDPTVVLFPADGSAGEWEGFGPLASRRLAATVVLVRAIAGVDGAEGRVRALAQGLGALGLRAPAVIVAQGDAAAEAELLAFRWPTRIAGLVLLDPLTAEVQAALGRSAGPAVRLGPEVPVRVVAVRRPGQGARAVAAQQELARRSQNGRAWIVDLAGGSVAGQAPDLALAAIADLIRRRPR